jgi:hypothetical protein
MRIFRSSIKPRHAAHFAAQQRCCCKPNRLQQPLFVRKMLTLFVDTWKSSGQKRSGTVLENQATVPFFSW